ncbi:SusC/RagA family TonB-linked outer membrane protein [Gracilimonas tropica]|uniref:SusC/RagA family TonB-linked outer membrane protein n=1 Tax=Gracilimonas tropica TaxID=454600 RepID=UPI0003A26A74|nr:SusC/RagA family TonB-linked outer membrane protein [Gracilimonas tropica]
MNQIFGAGMDKAGIKTFVIIVLGLILNQHTIAAQENGLISYQDRAQAEMSVDELLKKIEKRFDVTFIYESHLTNDLKVDKNLFENSDDFQSLLQKITELTGLEYERLGNRNFLVKLPHTPRDNFARVETVKGQVTDAATGETLPGVSILIKGSSRGTSTDAQGAFELTVPSLSDTLQFSFLGFEPKEVPIGGRTTLNVALMPEVLQGDEVVVVGYGTQTKKDLTGSVGSISDQDIEDNSYLSVDQALQGRLSGVQVVPSSGKPGAGVVVRIRGIGTINNSQPLFVVDGFPINGGLSSINVEDIASVDVLKDASATAIYGARGANGVVMITTKKGTAGKAQVDINAYSGYQQIADPINVLSAAQYARLNNEARINGGENVLNPAFSNPASVADSADWLNEIFRVAPIQNITASVSGGTDKLRYLVSGGVISQDGVIINSGFERKSFRINLDSDVSEYFSIGNNFTYSLAEFQNEGGGGLVRMAMNSLPNQPVRRNGDFSGPTGIAEFSGDELNPVGISTINEAREDKHRLLNNLFVALEPVSGVTLRSEFGVDISYELARSWSPKYDWGVKENPNSGVYESSYNRIDWLWDNTVTYDQDFKDHSVTVLGGMSIQKSNNRFIGASGLELVSDVANQLDNIQSNEDVFGSTSEFGLLSYMGRVNYDYRSKYLLTATARYDGSSRFGQNNRFGLFPSGSVAWRISQEEFMPEIAMVDDIKIRAGYGITGNQEAIPAFGYISLLDPTYRYTYGNSTVPAVIPQNLPNDDLRWEKVIQSSLGLDLILFDGSVDFTVEYYIRDTEDMLLQSPIPITSGFFDAQRPILNVGAVRNKGIEFSINTNKQFGDLLWNSSLNLSVNDNEILRLSGPNGDDPILAGQLTFNKYASRYEVGKPIGSFYGYVTDGIFQNWDEVYDHASQNQNPDGLRGSAVGSNYTAPGDIRYKDLNGDGVIDVEDRAFIGNPNPDFYYGFSNSFNYRNWDLSIFLQGSYGGEIFNANRVFSESMATAQNQLSSTLDRWRGEGTSTTVPRATTTDPNNNQRVSDRYVEDGSYLRIKNMVLGYSLPQNLMDKVNLRLLRVYASAQNLYTFTNYSGFDPEVGADGIDNSVYPPSRIITLGIKVGL